jgi:predicted kinase
MPADGPAAGPRLVVVCGLPGSGKTGHARSVAAGLGAVRMCPDEWMEALGVDLWDTSTRSRVEALQWTLTRELLALGQSVVIEWGTWSRDERDELRRGARAIGAAVELHFLDAPVDVLWARVAGRDRERPPISRADLAAWSEIIERPTAEELATYDPPAAPD